MKLQVAEIVELTLQNKDNNKTKILSIAVVTLVKYDFEYLCYLANISEPNRWKVIELNCNP